ncbi:MAG: hypothetical protein K0R26_229 [Bacteroidota bacterium]|jgi:uncharacterized protein (DUF2147 family)|nr:hypothetical protein [Bacteroidota bacterium]
MKIILSIFFALITFLGFSQNADALIGTYMTDKNEGMVDITKKGNKYFGVLTWTKTPGKLDANNPDKNQQGDKLAGKEILKDFEFDGKDLWHNGTIYDPKNGKTYSCKITRDDKGNLNVRGYIGVSMLGRTTFWVKVK